MERICRNCGKSFETSDGRRSCCTDECSKSRRLARNREYWHEANSPESRRISCRDCGAIFQAGRKDAFRCPECRKSLANQSRMALERTKAHPCLDCGQPCSRRSLRCLSCANKARVGERRGELSATWKGGRVLRKSDGYWEVRIGGVRLLEHRVVWEQANGPIPKGYVVHHLNGVKDDNRLENLACTSRASHGPRLHADPTLYEARIRDLEARVRELERET